MSKPGKKSKPQITIEFLPGFDARMVNPQDVASHTHTYLRSAFCHVDPFDLRECTMLYDPDNDGSGVMAKGITPAVKKHLEGIGHTVKFRKPKLERQYDWKSEFTPRNWQADALPVALKKRIGIIQARAGAGKTIFSDMLICAIGLPTLFVTEQGEPWGQALKQFSSGPLKEHLARFKAEKKDFGGVTVCTVQSIYSAIKAKDERILKELAKVKVLIVDEAHNIGKGNMYRMMADSMPNLEYIYGLTATPYRTDGYQWVMEAVCGTPIYLTTYGEGIEDGYLVPLTVEIKNVPPKDYGMVGRRVFSRAQRGRDFQAVYTDYVIQGSTGRNKLIVDRVKHYMATDRTSAVLVTKIPHGEKLKQMIPGAEFVHGGTKKKEREELIDKLRHREINCLITTLFEEAADVPSLDCVIYAGCGRQKKNAIQRMRNTRAFKGELRTGFYHKKRGTLFYPVDQCDFLKSQSTAILKVLKEEVASHETNKWVNLDKR